MTSHLDRRAFLGAMTFGSLMLPAAASARGLVEFPQGFEPGSVVVSTRQRMLFFVQGDGTAIRYPVAVGMPGKQWFGTRLIDGKHYRPAWSPPAEVRRAKPSLPDVIPGGAPNNPMGAGALTIAPGNMPSTAPRPRCAPRSGVMRRSAAFACSTRMCWISWRACASRAGSRWWPRSLPGAQKSLAMPFTSQSS